MICHDCGITIHAKQPNTKRCHECRRKHKAETEKAKRRVNGALPRGERRIEVTCGCCGETFQAQRITAKWCPKCAIWKAKILLASPVVRACRWCKKEMILSRGKREVTSQQYCSDECRRLGARKSRVESAKRMAHGEPKRFGGRPQILSREEAASRKKEGMTTRFFRNNPDRNKICEACGESRIVELAHKTPRNGAWRSLKRNTLSEHVWILCPTCHKCLDYGIETAQSLGLS